MLARPAVAHDILFDFAGRAQAAAEHSAAESFRVAREQYQAGYIAYPSLLAAAYAEAGRFPDAIKTAQRAIQLALPEIQEFLQLRKQRRDVVVLPDEQLQQGRPQDDRRDRRRP